MTWKFVESKERCLAKSQQRVRRVLFRTSVRRKMKHMPYLRAPGNCTSVPKPKWIGHTLVDEIAVHFWRTCLHHASILVCCNHYNAEFIPSGPQLWTDDMKSIRRLQRFVYYVWKDDTAKERCLKLRPERNSAECMMDLVAILLTKEDMAVESSAGVMEVPKTCLLLSEQRTFVDCKTDGGYVKRLFRTR